MTVFWRFQPTPPPHIPQIEQEKLRNKLFRPPATIKVMWRFGQTPFPHMTALGRFEQTPLKRHAIFKRFLNRTVSLFPRLFCFKYKLNLWAKQSTRCPGPLDERHANKQLLCWNSITDTEHNATYHSDEETK